MNALKMEGKKLHFHHIMLYKFREEKNVGTSTKKKTLKRFIRVVFQIFWSNQKWLGRFRQVDFNCSDQPRSRRRTNVDEDALLAIVVDKPKVCTRGIAKFCNSIFKFPYPQLSVEEERPI